ncbi:Predicted oxidoreductase [Chryseolinea serpens]|uniref:Predicted oxidoreductase n=1 Tax=Chryseolinea serpens TaxID=947013 RepID=A0A1M5XDQ6_9BACT|nr:aldo/keto reductase [Chryseolinea serpens]SHH98005.1 Predicted oxidoreductase [Chryseolinea serpens]
MERKALHKDGPVFSRIVVGAWRWNIATETVEQLIHKALDVGMTTFDHADIYGDHSNEEIFGRVLKQDPGLRQKMEIVSKCGIKFPSAKRPESWVKHYNTSKEHIVWSAENSLKMLGTDRLDLLLIHRPDPLLDPERVAEAFSSLRQSGKVLHFGVSNFTPPQFEMLQSYLPFPLVTNQLEISITHHSPLFDGHVDVLMKHRVAPMAWSPLGGGSLLGQHLEQIFSKAPAYQATPAQLSLAWLLRHPASIFPVIGTTKPERVAESAKATDMHLDIQDWFEMLKAVQGREMP